MFLQYLLFCSSLIGWTMPSSIFGCVAFLLFSGFIRRFLFLLTGAPSFTRKSVYDTRIWLSFRDVDVLLAKTGIKLIIFHQGS